MLLAIDVGNTRTHIGVFGGDRLIGDWHAATNDRATADDLAANITGVAGREGLDFDAIGIASVVPVVTQQLESMARRVFGVPAHAIEGSSELGLRVATDDPAQVGADRLANALAARNIAGRANAIVVDMGTATKVDAMSADGRFLGGAIAPGVTPAVGTLVDSAAGLPAPSGRPISSVGGTTRGAVNSGAVLGAAAMVDALVARVAAELDGGRARRRHRGSGAFGCRARLTDRRGRARAYAHRYSSRDVLDSFDHLDESKRRSLEQP